MEEWASRTSGDAKGSHFPRLTPTTNVSDTYEKTVSFTTDVAKLYVEQTRFWRLKLCLKSRREDLLHTQRHIPIAGEIRCQKILTPAWPLSQRLELYKPPDNSYV